MKRNYSDLILFKPSILIISFILICTVILSVSLLLKTNRLTSLILPSIELTPWKGIGGCGAGGSGGGTGDGIRWIGNGVSGGLINLEVLPKYTLGKNFHYVTIAPRFSFKPTYTTNATLQVPVQSKTGGAQFQSNTPEVNRTTGGMGDLYADFSRTFGMSGEYSLMLALSFPTGQYDIKRVRDREPEFLPVSLQMGSGLYSGTLTFARSIDVEDGIWMFDVSYSHPFALRPFSKKNEFLDTYFSEYKDRTDNKRFYYRAKAYGENDLGGYTPPSISATAYFGYRGYEGYVHSWGVMFGAPLGVAWIPSPIVNKYDPIPDPDHKAWSAALVYGLEFSKQKFPLFLAVSLPIHDIADPYGNWNGPDWKDFRHQWTFAFGFKTSLF